MGRLGRSSSACSRSAAEARNVIANKLHRWLLAGSVLELLVAVPTHVVVRRREECCAGMATGLGICVGIGVMIVGFGPSVALLYYRRWKQISRKSTTKNENLH